jgi:hypothetical protein
MRNLNPTFYGAFVFYNFRSGFIHLHEHNGLLPATRARGRGCKGKGYGVIVKKACGVLVYRLW